MSTVAPHSQQKCVPQLAHLIWLHPLSLETGMTQLGQGLAWRERAANSTLARSSSRVFLRYSTQDCPGWAFEWK